MHWGRSIFHADYHSYLSEQIVRPRTPPLKIIRRLRRRKQVLIQFLRIKSGGRFLRDRCLRGVGGCLRMGRSEAVSVHSRTEIRR